MARARRMLLCVSASAMLCACSGPRPRADPAVPPAPQSRIQDPDCKISPRQRGRDPWVFRCIFEDRTRMVVIALGDGMWIAFNPATCGIYKVWRGDIQLRGKVWDFSQDNSCARGEVVAEAPPLIWSLPEAPALPTGWTGAGVAPQGYAFRGDGATLMSPVFDTSGWDRVCLAFDEVSRAGPIRVELSADGGKTWDAQWFDSCTHGSSDDDWQWNFKDISVRSPETRVRFVQAKGSFNKRVRSVRMFGDRAAWTARENGQPVEVRPVWRGLELIGKTEGVVLLYDLVLSDGRSVAVRHWPEMVGQGGALQVEEELDVRGIPPDVVLTLALPRMTGGDGGGRALYGIGSLFTSAAGATVSLSVDGVCTLRTPIGGAR